MSKSNLRVYSDTTMTRARALFDFLESARGRDVRLEAIRQEIDAAYRRGLQDNERLVGTGKDVAWIDNDNGEIQRLEPSRASEKASEDTK